MHGVDGQSNGHVICSSNTLVQSNTSRQLALKCAVDVQRMISNHSGEPLPFPQAPPSDQNVLLLTRNIKI